MSTARPKKVSLKSVILLVALMLLPGSSAQAEQLPFKNFTTSDGLAHDLVNRIVRDSRGFLWFCTGEGLSRFDGYQFKNYSRDNGLPHRSIYDLLETRDGHYWVATGSGLVLFNPQGVPRRWTGRETEQEAQDESLMFRVFRAEDTQPGKWALDILRIIEGRNGHIWCATGTGLYQFEPNGADQVLRRINNPAWRGKFEEFNALLEDRSGAVWVAGPGLYRILPNGDTQVVSAELSLASLYEDRSGNVWAGTRGDGEGGLYQFAYNGPDAPTLLRTFTKKDGLSDHFWIFAILETTDGRFWVGVGNGFCEKVKAADNREMAFRAVSNMQVLSLGEDIGGNIWIGTESHGAFRLSSRGFQGFGQIDGLKSTRIASIVNGVSGDVYVLAGKIIHRFDRDRFTAVSPAGNFRFTWGANQVGFQDHTGEWWIPGYQGVWRYPKVNRLEDLARTKAKKIYTVKDGLPANMIFHLFEDSRGDVWIGTLGGTVDSLARWERTTEKIYGYTTKDNLPAYSGPTAFSEDHAGNLWIGYYAGGLVRYRQGRFQQFTEKEGLPEGLIRDIYTDKTGNVWVATSSSGAVRIDEPDAEQPKLVNFSTAQGLSSNQATCITEDRFGYIYIGTGRGVNRLDTATGRIKLFTEADGLTGNYVHVCKRDQTGALWFGSYRGVTRFVPEPDVQTAPPPILISDVIVNGAAYKKLSELGETSVENLDFASDQRQIQIEFFALGFSTGETLRYQYKLDSAPWSELTAQRTVNLNLSPGGYHFLVRAVNAEGIASQTSASVSFSIARPIWQRWWFIGIAALALGVLAYSLYRYRVRRFIELERVRTRIATDLHDDIGSNLSLIAMVSEVAQQQVKQDASPVMDQLSLVARTSRQSVDAMSDIVWAVNPKRDHLHDLVERMRRFASDTFAARDITFRFTAPPSKSDMKLGSEFRRQVYMIFKESINNMAKHSECTEAEIDLGINGGHLTLRLSDNGKGFDIASTENGYGGNGLGSMSQRAAALGGTLDITSRNGAGTTVTLRAPLGRR